MNKILIVEDEAIIRTALRKLLIRNKFDVSEAASVREATKHNLESFDLIISDLRLPGAPGTVPDVRFFRIRFLGRTRFRASHHSYPLHGPMAIPRSEVGSCLPDPARPA